MKNFLNKLKTEKDQSNKIFWINDSVKHSLGLLNPINGGLSFNFSEDGRHERSVFLLLSLTNPSIKKAHRVYGSWNKDWKPCSGKAS